MAKSIILLLTLAACVPAHAHVCETKAERIHVEHDPTDSIDKKLSIFRAFATEYFECVKKGDTSFLRAHTIFPIKHSSFDVLDWSLHGVNITPGIFFKRLHKLFPSDLMIDIKKIGKYYVTPKGEAYTVECHYNTGGIDSNVTWHFLKKNGQFYFESYLAEAG